MVQWWSAGLATGRTQVQIPVMTGSHCFEPSSLTIELSRDPYFYWLSTIHFSTRPLGNYLHLFNYRPHGTLKTKIKWNIAGGAIGDVSVTWRINSLLSNASRDSDYVADGATLNFLSGDITRGKLAYIRTVLKSSELWWHRQNSDDIINCAVTSSNVMWHHQHYGNLIRNAMMSAH